MRTVAVVLLIFFLTACAKKVAEKKSDRLYYLGTCQSDTTFIDKISFDPTKLTVIAKVHFDNDRNQKFSGEVIKLSNEPAPIDGGQVYYLTHDLGIIYSKSTTWPCYRRLHSSNDSVEKRINEYLEHILSNPNFVMKGEAPLPVLKTVKFTPPVVEDK